MSDRKKAASGGKTPSDAPDVPKKAVKASRTQFNLRLSANEKGKLERLAGLAGLDMTAYLLITSLRQAGGEGDDSPDFTERSGGKQIAATSHEANLKHLLNWTQILAEQGVNIGALRDALKLHLNQSAAEQTWQEEARKRGRQLVLASKLGTDETVIQEMADSLNQYLRQHLRGRQ